MHRTGHIAAGHALLPPTKTEDSGICLLRYKTHEKKAKKEVTALEHERDRVHAALKSAGNARDLETGMKIHASLVATGDELCKEIINSLIHMYIKCQSMRDARLVFEKLSQPSTVSWKTLISGYVDNKDFTSALLAYGRMQDEAHAPDSQTFIAAVKACAGLAAEEQGRKVEGKVVKLRCLETCMILYSIARKYGYEQELTVGNSLLHAFTKCRSMTDATIVFQRMENVTSVSWTAIMFGYVENGENVSALETFKRMQDEGFKPTAATYVAAVKACAKNAAKEKVKQVDGKAVKVWSLEVGMNVHSQARDHVQELDAFLTNTLVDMYAKCGCLDYALEAFKTMQRPSVVSWNTLISGCAENGDSEAALSAFQRMQREGVTPNARTYVAALQACASDAGKDGNLVKAESLRWGRAIHSQAKQSGHELELQVGNTLTHMYAKCGSLVDARKVFDRMPVRDTVSYNILMFGYAENGDGEAALQVYARLKDEGVPLSSLTHLAALKACACAAAREDEKGKARLLVTGREIHSEARKSGREMDIFVESTLLDMYSKCRSMSDAREVFDRMTNHDVVSWNAMIFGYEEAGEEEMALEFFQRMEKSGCKPDGVTYLAVLKASAACAEKSGRDGKRRCLERGRDMHAKLESSGCELDMFLASTVVDFYAKCGSLCEARNVFERMPLRDVVSWNALIYACTECGEFEMAVDLFRRMEGGERSVRPNAITFTALFKACGSLAALEAGRTMHGQVYRDGVQESLLLVSSVVDFYGKCGSTLEAEQAFISMGHPARVVTWNALMSGYAHQGNSRRVFDILESMRNEDVKADEVTFLAVLTACTQAGLADKARRFLQVMSSEEFNVTPGIKHYTCMVDLLGRSNRLDEAVEMVNGLGSDCDGAIWRAVLCASKKWKNVEAGRVAFERLKLLEPRDVSAYILMGNLYAALGMWEEKGVVWEEKCRGAVFDAIGESCWTDSHGLVHRFTCKSNI